MYRLWKPNQTAVSASQLPFSSLTRRASCPWWDVRDPAGLHYIVGGGDPTLVTQFAVVAANSLAVYSSLLAIFDCFSSWQNHVLGSIFVGGGRRQLFARNLELFFFVWPVRHILCLRGLVRTEAWPKCKKTFYSNEASGFGLEVKNWKKWKRHFGKIRETSFLPFYLWNTDNAGPVD